MDNFPRCEELKQGLEELKELDPDKVFKGAILASGNCLVTDYEQVVSLFSKMQDGSFGYPESLRQAVESVKIYRNYIKPVSDQIDWIFRGISYSSSVNLDWRDFPGRWGWYGGVYKLSEEAAADLMNEMSDNEELMEFFCRCADFLAIKK